MLGRGVNRMIAAHGFAYPWGDLLPAVRSADCFLINLECALTDHTGRWHDGGHKPFYFRASPRVVETLRVAEVDFASLANNHAADFGMTGLLDRSATSMRPASPMPGPAATSWPRRRRRS